jgi:hypothetical protein
MTGDKLIDAYVTAASEILPLRFNSTRCLNGSRVALDVFRRFKVHCFPMSVVTHAYNAAYVKRWQELGGHPTEENRAEWYGDTEAWSIAVGRDHDDERVGWWRGHLVVIARGFLVDSSASSMHRPKYGMDAGHVVALPTTPEFLRGEAILLENPDGMRVIYRPKLGDNSYKKIEGFQRSAHNIDAAKAIITRMKEIL